MPGDPRFHLAAQRTLLAWLRTGIAVMAFGFVLARLAWLAHLIGGGDPAHHPEHAPAWLGIALVALGIFATASGAVQYQRFCRTLPPEERPEPVTLVTTTVLAWSLAAAGVVLAVLLVP